MKKNVSTERPTTVQLQQELKRVNYVRQYRAMLKSTICTLITVAAAAVLAATLWLPVLQIYGNSMAPTLHSGEILLCIKTVHAEQGDLVAFYSGNKLLVKRVIAVPGDWVDLKDDGSVYVNGQELSEPYLSEKAFGDADVAFPLQVPEGSVFVMGDHRATSVDSRHTAVGCVAQEQIVGKLIFRIWPFNRLGGVY